MFKSITNLAEAVVSVAVTPATLTMDIVALATGADNETEEFHRTDGALENAIDCLEAIIHSNDEEE